MCCRIGTERAALAVVFLVVFGVACQTPPRRSISEEELLDRRDEFLSAYQSDLDRIARGSLTRIQQEYADSVGAAADEGESLDILVLSGGGAFGAFGAGYLKGWGQLAGHELARPRFDQVSGISTGALIAPFAFLGTRDAYDTIIELYQNPGRDWVRKRGIIPYLPGNVSLFDTSKLRRKIRDSITPEMIHAIGGQASSNRQLLVGATNADYGLLRVWDLAAIADRCSPEDALEQTISILQASSAIPGFFPPIVIDDFLYVDGGAVMQVVGGIDQRDWLYGSDPNELAFVDSTRPIRLRVWMIVNQKLLPDPAVVRSRWTSISARSINTLVRTSTLQSIQDTDSLLRAIDAHPAFQAEFRYVAIPQDFPIPDSDEMFDSETMRALVDLGLQMGADPASWKTEALRPGAPFQSVE